MSGANQAIAQPSTCVILVRHGRSTFNEQGRYQGSSDESVLIDKGEEAARRVGSLLKEITIDAVYASPLKRVEQTVDAITSAMQLGANPIPIYRTWQLREIDLPTWEGLPFDEVRERFPEAYRCWKQRPHEFQISIEAASEESAITSTSQFFPVLDLYDRAQQFWQTVLPKHIGQTLLIVSHGGTNHALISTALGLSPIHHHTLQQSNCGVSVLEFPMGNLNQGRLQSLNLTHYLGESLPKLKEGKQGLRLLLVPTVTDVELLQPLIECFKTISIHGCLSPHSKLTQEITNFLLHHHPGTVQYQLSQKDFASLRQRLLTNCCTYTSDLVTVLVVADPETIQSLLIQAISPNIEPWRFFIQSGATSILHYPSTAQPPILQALNFGVASQKLLGSAQDVMMEN